jgi:mono/diheme cytochrome c family protein
VAKKAFDLKPHLPSAAFLLVVFVIIAAFAAIFVASGIYDIAADSPHTPFVESMIRSTREHSIAAHSKGIPAPRDLGDPKRIAAGAGLYDEMCTGCHLGPGLERTELSQGLSPPAPELAQVPSLGPRQQFWIIKHGVRFTAMPAWGKTHDDQLIWDMVAFLQKLPGMSPQQYRAEVASAPADHDEMMKHMRGGVAAD